MHVCRCVCALWVGVFVCVCMCVRVCVAVVCIMLTLITIHNDGADIFYSFTDGFLLPYEYIYYGVLI